MIDLSDENEIGQIIERNFSILAWDDDSHGTGPMPLFRFDHGGCGVCGMKGPRKQSRKRISKEL